MEISSFPFLNQDDYSSPSLSSFLQNLDLINPKRRRALNDCSLNRPEKEEEEDGIRFRDFDNTITSSSSEELKLARPNSSDQTRTLFFEDPVGQSAHSMNQTSEELKLARPDSSDPNRIRFFEDPVGQSAQSMIQTESSSPGKKRARREPATGASSGMSRSVNQSESSSGKKRARRDPATGVSPCVSLSMNQTKPFPEPADVIPATEESSGVLQSQRRLWVKDRSKAWWEYCDSADFPEEEFRRAFRMSRATFDSICDELELAVTKKDTMLRLAVPVPQRVAVCLWRLATGEPLREVSRRFGLGISTCHKLVLEVCSAIKNVLMPKYVQWPDNTKMDEIKQGFESISGISNVVGAMYTTHVPIIAPKANISAYFNKKHTERNHKTSYSVTIQGVVDPRGMFTDVCIGWPGSMADDKVLENSALYQRASRGLLKNVWIAGNSGYPLMDWVLVPYTNKNLTWTQHAFNEKIGELQNVAKEAFTRLKGRWSCLQKRTEVKLQDLPVVLGACCVLHNICELRNEEMDRELRFDLFDDKMVAENSSRSMTAVLARDQIAFKLLHHNHAGTNFL